MNSFLKQSCNHRKHSNGPVIVRIRFLILMDWANVSYLQIVWDNAKTDSLVEDCRQHGSCNFNRILHKFSCNFPRFAIFHFRNTSYNFVWGN